MLMWIHEHLGIILMVLGIILLAVEMLAFAFRTCYLFFLGLAFLITCLLVFLGLLAANWLMVIIAIGVLSGLSAAVLWKPLKDMQDH